MSCGKGYECSAEPGDGCGEHFVSVDGFDAHRIGLFVRRCLTTKEMLGLGFTKDPRGFWRDPKTSRRMTKGGASLTQRGPSGGGMRPLVNVEGEHRESSVDGGTA